ncbi:hypothetical protein BO78DRAFT_42523 [Aspergillus sclerotiicarbonarius CBS 121057]|uniref:Uncharacterized protein n=1 Tax=Aspergillus sclerotiicarbonarius (strain CBS 121057 / IBT 28362) TaxID=1448318 RepID=A0A319DW89_ASPSB|nr:hypothetical protein BO78DRAFT_42523 [Aspergillus sclerotiicarbonarius CBS 121057]
MRIRYGSTEHTYCSGPRPTDRPTDRPDRRPRRSFRHKANQTSDRNGESPLCQVLVTGYACMHDLGRGEGRRGRTLGRLELRQDGDGSDPKDGGGEIGSYSGPIFRHLSAELESDSESRSRVWLVEGLPICTLQYRGIGNPVDEPVPGRMDSFRGTEIDSGNGTGKIYWVR